MTVKQKQHLLAYLGYYQGNVDGIWGAQSQSAADRFLKDFGPTEKLEKALTHAVCYGMPEYEKSGFWDEIEYFTREEFRCKCGGKYCDGFPAEPREDLVRLADGARKHFGRPANVISGLRCPDWNRIQGGVGDSQHQYGEACDIQIPGVSSGDILAWFQAQPGVRYAYAINASNVHFDVPKGVR